MPPGSPTLRRVMRELTHPDQPDVKKVEFYLPKKF